jgi:hypothetical protein
MACSSAGLSGINKNSGIDFDKVKNLLIFDAGTRFPNKAAFKNLASWLKFVREDQSLWVGRVPTSYEVTTEDKEVITFASGKKRVVGKPIPSGLFYLDASFTDTKMLLKNLFNANKEVMFELSNGSIHATKHPDGSIGGFSGVVDVSTKGIAQASDIGNNTPLTFFGDNYDEWKNAVLECFDWSPSDKLKFYMPNGVDFTEESIYNSTTGKMQVDLRGRDGIALEDADVVIASFEFENVANLDTLAISAVDNIALGVHELTIQKESTPTNLVLGDTFRLRYIKKTVDIIDAVSDYITITVI